jgi:GSH-dependent disulfide-bond oxidoreductase
MILYHGELNGASLTALAALFETGLDIECRAINLIGGERHRLAGITGSTALDMGIEGEGPVLVVDGEAITESVFLAQYFDELAGGAGLQPSDPFKHWEMLMWCRRVTERGSPATAFLKCHAYAHPALAKLDDAEFKEITDSIVSDDLRQRWQDVRAGAFSSEQLEDSREKSLSVAATTEAMLTDGRDWLMGDFSIADLVTFSWIAEELVPEALEGRPNLVAWRARMKARPSVQRALALAKVPDPDKCWAPGPEINRWG